MRMSRYWTSGCLALVLAAAGRWPMAAERDDVETDRRGWVTMTSALPLDQAARRLQNAAQAQGLPVLADVAPIGPVPELQEPKRVLVLGHEDGHTPVMQNGDSGAVDLPLRVLLQQLPDGRTQVMFTDPAVTAARTARPADAWRDLAALPGVVSAALGGDGQLGPPPYSPGG